MLRFVKKADYNAKINELKIKITNVSNLVKKTDYDTKISKIEKKVANHIHDKYSTTPKFNTFTAEAFDDRIGRANLITQTNFDNELISFNKKTNSNKTKHNKKTNSNKTKHVLVENELKNLQTFD